MMLLIFLLTFCMFSNSLPRCSQYGDTYGRWVNTTECIREPQFCSKHFLSGLTNDVVKFSQVWLPSDCAYYRFTNTTLLQATKHLAASRPTSVIANGGKLKLIFVGDSALRGIYCGISRIISGSEIYGPCANRVCGNCNDQMPPSYNEAGKAFDVVFGDELIMTFVYSKSFHLTTHLDWLIESKIDYDPAYALIFHQGLWDYNEFSRLHMNETASETVCEGEYLQIAKSIANEFAYHTMHDLGYYGSVHNIRLIFKNSHFNNRYPAVCDQYFAPLLNNSGWEIWDNHRISKAVWRDQNFDGFHFDRSEVCSIADHVKNRAYYEQHHRNYSGMMEIQLAQSLLNSIFYNEIESLL